MLSWVIVWVLLFVTVFFLSAFISIRRLGGRGALPYQDGQDERVTVLSGLPYENGRGHLYDLYLPDEGVIRDKKSRKVILYIHGGSYNSGAKEDGRIWCGFYAAKGYVTASLDYSLHKHGYDTSLNEMYREVHRCVAAIKDKTAELEREGRIPQMESLAVCGCSAGGTLALGYAAKYGKEAPLPISDIFTLAAPVDFEPKYWGLLKWVDKVKTDEEFLTLMTGHTVSSDMMTSKEYEKYVDEISPARLISDEMQGIRLVVGYGLKDHCVPAEQKELLMEALDRHRIEYRYFPFPNCNHGMYRDLEVHERFIEAVLEALEKENFGIA